MHPKYCGPSANDPSSYRRKAGKILRVRSGSTSTCRRLSGKWNAAPVERVDRSRRAGFPKSSKRGAYPARRCREYLSIAFGIRAHPAKSGRAMAAHCHLFSQRRELCQVNVERAEISSQKVSAERVEAGCYFRFNPVHRRVP